MHTLFVLSVSFFASCFIQVKHSGKHSFEMDLKCKTFSVYLMESEQTGENSTKTEH